MGSLFVFAGVTSWCETSLERWFAFVGSNSFIFNIPSCLPPDTHQRALASII